MNWSPETYERFAGDRLVPLHELLDAIDIQPANNIVDLGCGSGAAIPHLRKKWPEAHILAIDNDPVMLERLHERHPDIPALQQTIQDWSRTKDALFNLIFSNAALHWVADHKTIIFDLLQKLTPTGTLAIQVPNNWQAPAHRAMFDLAKQQPWWERISGLVRPTPLLSMSQYDELLNQHCTSHRIWETTYTHMLEGDSPVLNWLKGSTLGVILSELDADESSSFEAQLASDLADAYPREQTGQTRFDFRRLFMIAQNQD